MFPLSFVHTHSSNVHYEPDTILEAEDIAIQETCEIPTLMGFILKKKIDINSNQKKKKRFF